MDKKERLSKLSYERVLLATKEYALENKSDKTKDDDHFYKNQ